MGALTLFRQVKIKNIIDVNDKEVEKGSAKYGNKLFIPAIVLAVVAVVVSNWTPLGGAIGLGISSIVGLIAALLIIKPKLSYTLYDSDRLTQQVGTTGILPQFLVALGVLFTASGVGQVISKGISSFLPEGNHLIGAIAYILGMVLLQCLWKCFRGIYCYNSKYRYSIRYCTRWRSNRCRCACHDWWILWYITYTYGANFNTLPVALLEMKQEFGVIKAQAPIALALIVIHIALMYFWAF